MNDPIAPFATTGHPAENMQPPRSDNPQAKTVYLSSRCEAQIADLAVWMCLGDRASGQVVETAIGHAYALYKNREPPWSVAARAAGHVDEPSLKTLYLGETCRLQMAELVRARPDGAKESASSVIRKAVAAAHDRAAAAGRERQLRVRCDRKRALEVVLTVHTLAGPLVRVQLRRSRAGRDGWRPAKVTFAGRADATPAEAEAAAAAYLYAAREARNLDADHGAGWSEGEERGV